MPVLAPDFGIWWDRWSAPRRLDNEAPDADLKQMLRMAIERADTAIIIRSRDYETTHWTAYEYSTIMERKERPRFEIEDAKIRQAIERAMMAQLVDQIRAKLAIPGS
jgi:hypothetical protein